MSLPGEKEVLALLDRKTLDLFRFGEEREIHIEKAFDEASGETVDRGYLVLSDGENLLKVEMDGICGEFLVKLGGELEGFGIADCAAAGYESENRYHLYDFEDRGALSVYCADLRLSLLR